MEAEAAVEVEVGAETMVEAPMTIEAEAKWK